jgi:hypothetical protein
MDDSIPFHVDLPFDMDLPFEIEPPQPTQPLRGDEVARFLKGERWASFVDGFRITDYELGILAQHFLDVGYDMAMFERLTDTYDRSEHYTQYAASCRLDDIEQALGAKKFAAAIAKKEAKWKQKFAKADKAEQAMACVKCGAKRYLSELLNPGAHKDLCGYCTPADVAGQCAKCGRQRDGERRDITGDLCEQCYVESPAPCANCGGKRDMRHRDALCYVCHTAPIAPCQDCGATRHRYDISYIDGEFDHGYCSACTL